MNVVLHTEIWVYGWKICWFYNLVCNLSGFYEFFGTVKHRFKIGWIPIGLDLLSYCRPLIEKNYLWYIARLQCFCAAGFDYRIKSDHSTYTYITHGFKPHSLHAFQVNYHWCTRAGCHALIYQSIASFITRKNSYQSVVHSCIRSNTL
jgi:hypothetical protein